MALPRGTLPVRISPPIRMTRRLHHILQLARRRLVLGPRTLLMGVLNVTPDSFSDGGLYTDLSNALDRALEMEAEGADILDVGGESTRPPHHEILPVTVELRRVIPVVEKLSARLKIPISVDTYKAEVANAALEAGAEIINDIGSLRFDHGLLPAIVRHKAAVVLMHSRGTPGRLHDLPPLQDVVASVQKGLRNAVQRALRGGVEKSQIVLDPGLGFGKSAVDNLLLLRKLDRMAAFRMPLLVGASRKSFIGKVLNQPVEERLYGSLACVAAAIAGGAHIIRVHEVGPSRQVAKMCDAIREAGFGK